MTFELWLATFDHFGRKAEVRNGKKIRIKGQYLHVVVYSESLKTQIYPELLYTPLVLPSITSALRKECRKSYFLDTSLSDKS